MADHDGYCQTCKWCVSWTQQEQVRARGPSPTSPDSSRRPTTSS